MNIYAYYQSNKHGLAIKGSEIYLFPSKFQHVHNLEISSKIAPFELDLKRLPPNDLAQIVTRLDLQITMKQRLNNHKLGLIRGGFELDRGGGMLWLGRRALKLVGWSRTRVAELLDGRDQCGTVGPCHAWRRTGGA